MTIKKHTILARGTVYTVLRRNEKAPQPYVVAWHYNEKRGDWEQGHYFDTAAAALAWFHTHDPANCTLCEYTCPHRDTMRRLPAELGGLGLCLRLEGGGMYADY